jgi:pimeloyl-ACP methyl ester carboxylesterase
MSTILDALNLLRLRLVGFRSEFVDTPQGRIHALVCQGKGSLPPVVLIAGLSSRATHFSRMAPRLRKHVRRIVLLDMPGHGLSEVPADGLTGPSLKRGTIAALDGLIEEPAVVFGNSLGGFLALRHALHSSDKVLGLVLASPGGAMMDPLSQVEFLQRFRLRSHQDALVLIDRIFYRVPRLVRWVMALQARRQLAKRHIRHLLNTSKVKNLLTIAELRTLKMPIRMLWGAADGVLPESHREFFQRGLPDAQWVTPHDYGHSPYIERPVHLVDQIVEFMETQLSQQDWLSEAC